MGDTIGVGVIGCGGVAQIMHLHYLDVIPEFRIAALCDISAAQLALVADRYQVPADRRYTDFQDLVTCPDVDAVLVLTAGSHAEPAIAAANAGKHVFVEKPMCHTPREADAMIAAAEAAGVTLMVGYMKAYDPTYQTALGIWREMWQQGEVHLIRVHDINHDNPHVIRDLYGPAVLHAQANDVGPERLAQLNAEASALYDEALGDVAGPDARVAYRRFLGILTHDTSILMLAFGEPRRIRSAEVWDEGQGLISVFDYGERTRCVLESSRGGQHWMDESLSVYAPKRQAILEFPSPFQRNGPTVFRYADNAGAGWAERRETSSLTEAFQRELEHFRDCIQTGRRPLTDGEVGKRNVELGRDVIRLAFGRPSTWVGA